MESIDNAELGKNYAVNRKIFDTGIKCPYNVIIFRIGSLATDGDAFNK